MVVIELMTEAEVCHYILLLIAAIGSDLLYIKQVRNKSTLIVEKILATVQPPCVVDFVTYKV